MSSISLPAQEIRDYCAKRPIRSLSLFGSALGTDFGPSSDVDLLVEFVPGASVGLLEMVQLEDDLSEIIGRRVDLRTAAELSRYFREQVVAGAERIYGN